MNLRRVFLYAVIERANSRRANIPIPAPIAPSIRSNTSSSRRSADKLKNIKSNGPPTTPCHPWQIKTGTFLPF